MQQIDFPRPVRLAHIALRSARFEAAVEWYKRVLGAAASFENSEIAFLTYDDEHHRIAIVSNPTLTEASDTASGVHHMSFTYETLEDLMATYVRLKDVGIVPAWCINHGPTTSMYYVDPDSNRVELQVENFATLEESTNYFFSDAFANNPIGVEFDPDDLVKRVEEGATLEDIRARGDIGKRGVSNLNLT